MHDKLITKHKIMPLHWMLLLSGHVPNLHAAFTTNRSATILPRSIAYYFTTHLTTYSANLGKFSTSHNEEPNRMFI